jgi:CheY-like chemotaxis protein
MPGNTGQCMGDLGPVRFSAVHQEEFERQRPNVVLADIAMHGLNGYALITEVRRLDAERGSHTTA